MRPDPAATSPSPAGVRAGLCTLLVAFRHAFRDRLPLGDCALPRAVLLHAGLPPEELERLVAAGVVRWHAGAALPAAWPRLADCEGDTLPAPADGYVLTATGLAAAFQMLPQAAGAPAAALELTVRRPSWRDAARELWWGSRLVKQFRHDAANQRQVLDAFERQGWPPRIDDPLPAAAGVRRKPRLREAIRGLHRGQRPLAVRFAADGAGGIRWEAVV